LSERKLQFNVGTNKTLEVDKEGERDIVPKPSIGDETSLALIIAKIMQHKNVIWLTCW